MTYQVDNPTTLSEQDESFKALGATGYHNSYFPKNWTEERLGGRTLSSRHYFNKEGTEIGYVNPDFFSLGLGVHVFETPRVWGDHLTKVIRPFDWYSPDPVI